MMERKLYRDDRRQHCGNTVDEEYLLELILSSLNLDKICKVVNRNNECVGIYKMLCE